MPPYFRSDGEEHNVGSAGMGEVAKLVNNLLCLINLAGLSDAIALGLKAGLCSQLDISQFFPGVER